MCILFYLYIFFFFFFSSRRRHTRWNCDWSSDVCSSDLPNRSRMIYPCSVTAAKRRVRAMHSCFDQACSRSPSSQISSAIRSEEHTSELQSQFHLVCRLLLEKKKKIDE